MKKLLACLLVLGFAAGLFAQFNVGAQLFTAGVALDCEPDEDQRVWANFTPGFAVSTGYEFELGKEKPVHLNLGIKGTFVSICLAAGPSVGVSFKTAEFEKFNLETSLNLDMLYGMSLEDSTFLIANPGIDFVFTKKDRHGWYGAAGVNCAIIPAIQTGISIFHLSGGYRF